MWWACRDLGGGGHMLDIYRNLSQGDWWWGISGITMQSSILHYIYWHDFEVDLKQCSDKIHDCWLVCKCNMVSGIVSYLRRLYQLLTLLWMTVNNVAKATLFTLLYLSICVKKFNEIVGKCSSKIRTENWTWEPQIWGQPQWWTLFHEIWYECMPLEGNINLYF